MKLKHKIGSVLAGAMLLVTGGIVADATVSENISGAAAISNFVSVEGSKTACFRRGTSTFNYCIPPGAAGTNLDKVVVKPFTCVTVNQWFVNKYCATRTQMLVNLPGGNVAVYQH